MADNHSKQTNEYGQLFRQIRSYQTDGTGPYTEEQSERALVASRRSDALSIAIRAITLVVVCTLLVAACGQTHEADHEADLAIRGVTVVDVTDGSLVPDQTVLVQGDRIVAVGLADTIRVAEGTEVVEADGGYLVPGLWDAHVHSATNVEWHFPLFLAHGVTSVRNMHTTVDDPLALVVSIKRQIEDGDLLGPIEAKTGQNVRSLHEEGVVILAGTDVGNPFLVPGLSLHGELEWLTEAGLSPLEALRAATLLPARVFGLEEWSRPASLPTSSSSTPTPSRTSPTHARSSP